MQYVGNNVYNHLQNIWDKLYFSFEIVHYGKSSISIFRRFLLKLTKFSFEEEEQTLGNNSMKFWGFLDIFYFSNSLSLKSFGNSYILAYYE